jgi:hypothetical protein
VRHLALVAIVLASGCGRSTFGPRADAGNIGEDASKPEDLAGRDSAVMDASVDLGGGEIEAALACNDEVGDRYVVSCGGGYQFITEMFDGRDACPTYFVYESTHRAYDLLGDLLSENGCELACRWEADVGDVVDCSGQMNRMTVTSVTGYADHFRTCPLPVVWFSNVTSRFYTTHDEARATLPVCADAGP